MRADDRQELSDWLQEALCPLGVSTSEMVERTCQWCFERRLVSPSGRALERLARSLRQWSLDDFLRAVAAALPADTAAKMTESLQLPDMPGRFHAAKADAGRTARESFLKVAGRLAFIRSLGLPRSVLSRPGTPWTDRVCRRVRSENASEMRRHPRHLRLGMSAVFLKTREAEIIDGLVDLLVETIHKIGRIGRRAERKVALSLARDVEQVFGKEKLLADIALPGAFKSAQDFAVSAAQLGEAVIRVARAEPRTELMAREEGGLRFRARSRLLGRPDLIEVRPIETAPERSSLASLSRARYGLYDLGGDRRRVTRWLRALEAELGG